jgi:hypothetical protein
MKATSELKVAQAAYRWIELGYYDSEAKALKALHSRKGMENVDPTDIKNHLHMSVEILNRIKDLRSEALSAYGKTSITELTEIECSSVRSQLESALEKEYPGSDTLTGYLLGMLWDMPALR